MKIIIGTTNPAKVAAVKNAFISYKATFDTSKVPSGVSEQPLSDKETIQGAINRATHALQAGNGDLGIGLEGGVHETEHGLMLCNWGALAFQEMPPLIAGGARILLPEEVAVRIHNGEELGPVMDDYANEKNISKKEGAIGVFTNNKISRTDMFTHVMQLLVGQYEYNRGRANF